MHRQTIRNLVVLLISVADFPGAQAQGPQSQQSVQSTIRQECGVDAAKTSGNTVALKQAVSCVANKLKSIIDDAALQSAAQPGAGVPAVTPSSTLGVQGDFEKILGLSGMTMAVTANTAAPNSSTPVSAIAPAAGTELRESAYNTPTACDAGATDGDSQSVIAVHRELLAPRTASDDFGHRLGRRFIIYKVSVTNRSGTLQFSVADISIDLKEILPNDAKGGPYPYPRYLASGNDLALLRGVPEKGQDLDPRNLTLHVFQGVGAVGAGVSGLTTFSDVMGSAMANFNGAFLQAFTGIAPDHTSTQLNRLSDMAFSPNSLIDKFGTKTYAVFIPEALLLTKKEQGQFWSKTRELLNSKPFDKLDVCVDGQLLTPAATAKTVTFSPDGGNVAPATKVTLTSAGSDVIYYTIDGSVPNTTTSIKYTAPFAVSQTVGATITVQAIATAANQVPSPVASRSFTTLTPATKPTISPAGGAIPANQLVTLSPNPPGGGIYYTINGDTPTANSTLYTAPFIVNAPATVKAIAISPTTAQSDVATASYTLSKN